MSRLDNLSEHDLERRIKHIRVVLFELKRPQRFGSHSVRTYRIFSQDTYDVELTNIQDFDNPVIEVTFTPSNLSAALGGAFQMKWSLVSGAGVIITEEALVPDSGLSKWRLYVRRSPFVDPGVFPTIRVKFWFWANSSGTFTAQLI